MQYDPEIRRRALDMLDRTGPAPTHLRIAELAGTNRRVLELGCATGYVSRLLQQQGCAVTGIELDPDAAREAEQYCERVIVGDVQNPEVIRRAGTDFQAILCGDILEHLPDPWQVLKTLRKILTTDGFVLVSMPNVAYWKMRWDLVRGRFEYQDFGLLDRTHLRFFSYHTFRKLAQDSGYRITQVVMNDVGFPGSDLFRRIPGIKRGSAAAAHRLAQWFPNLFLFHAIYRLIPESS